MSNPIQKEIELKDSPYKKRHRDDRPKLPPKDQLNIISRFFLNNSNGKYNWYEMEAKFGTRGIKRITKMDYDNVVKKIKSLGFTSKNEQGFYTLKIQPEFMDIKTGEFKISGDIDRYRIEIKNIDSIQEYCKTNNLNLVNEKKTYNLNILKKTDVRQKIRDEQKEIIEETIESANFDDFNFRVTLKNEEKINKQSTISKELFDNWNRHKKVFRYMNRVSFIHPELPFQIDLSIVKSSTKNEKGWMIQTYNIDESNVFNNKEEYEIEIEVLDEAKQLYGQSVEELSKNLQKVVKYVLCGLQKTNFPVSYLEQRETIMNYHKLLFEDDYKKKREPYVTPKFVNTSDFIGPSLVTLDLINIGPINPNVIVPNITEPSAYCVTDKADGDRHLLYINDKGRIYLINMNMNVIFTGAITHEENCFNSLLDGELILHDKKDNFINIFAAFDIYYFNQLDVRAKPFVKTTTKDEKYFEEGCRLPMLQQFVKILKPVSILVKDDTAPKSKIAEAINKYKAKHVSSPITIVVKNFYPLFDTIAEGEAIALSKYNIFEACNYLLRKIGDGLFEYDIDGLIFTPTLLGVGSNKFLEAGPKRKTTWEYCFKWKPSVATSIFPQSYNTIDFLVITKKNTDGSDIVTPVFENGINSHETTQYNQYKTLILAVGFDSSKHGYINPCQDVLDDKFVDSKNIDDETGYKPKQFFPSNPFDPLAGLCNIMLEMDNNGSFQMFTEERQVFEDQTVVEFRYDMSKTGMWKWIPMRVRYDKTADFKANIGVGANDYKTANNNWHTIHNPVTELMITTGEGIPGIEVSDDVYYNSLTSDKLTRGMRDFHNLYVKKTLIQGVSRRGNTLIDFACGKAGDLPKWIGANLSFVFGIDISKDNIENRLNGACARYLNFKKTNNSIPYALFVNGNSALNIRNGKNMFTDKANEIVKSIFGTSSDVNNSLGPAVARQQGKSHNGFDVSSCQFAIHYMFENKKTFYNFIRNVAECTKINGYFIATCYDGRTIFNMLKKKEEGESTEIYTDDKKIWSVTKSYDATTFDDNESCLGYKIDVYQDSINQTLSEYLVNFDFLTSTMDKYGFTLVSREDARKMGLPNGSGMFSELYYSMENELKRDPKKESDYKDAPFMKEYEKNISFLNRFFVYKKTSTRNAEQLTKVLLEQLPDEISFEQAGTMLAREAVKEAEEVVKPKAKKLREKLRLQEATEVFEEEKAQKKIKNTKKKNIKMVIQEDEEV